MLSLSDVVSSRVRRRELLDAAMRPFVRRLVMMNTRSFPTLPEERAAFEEMNRRPRLFLFAYQDYTQPWSHVYALAGLHWIVRAWRWRWNVLLPFIRLGLCSYTLGYVPPWSCRPMNPFSAKAREQRRCMGYFRKRSSC